MRNIHAGRYHEPFRNALGTLRGVQQAHPKRSWVQLKGQTRRQRQT